MARAALVSAAGSSAMPRWLAAHSPAIRPSAPPNPPSFWAPTTAITNHISRPGSPPLLHHAALLCTRMLCWQLVNPSKWSLAAVEPLAPLRPQRMNFQNFSFDYVEPPRTSWLPPPPPPPFR